MSLINKIRIKNFKSLEDVEIDMNQLNFLFGPNSSGKSSFLKAMMFLSKNMLPLNTGKTIYKISDEVDLGSYKDIVTNNDESKRIIFEIDFEGEYEFPKLEVFKNRSFQDKYGISSTPEYEDLFNFFREIDSYIGTIITTETDFRIKDINYKNFKNALDYPLEVNHYNLTISIVFSNFEADYNFTRMSIKDNINESKYNFVRKDKFPNDDDGENGMVTREQFVFLNNFNLSKEFNYGYYEDDLTILTNELTFSPEFNLSEVIGLDSIEEYWDPMKGDWLNLNDDEKLKFYFESIRFLYFSHRLIPKFLKSLLDFKHLPTTREIPKKIYLLERNDFKFNEYYGLLFFLSEEFYPKDYIGFEVSPMITNKSYDLLLDNIKSTIESDGSEDCSFNFSIYKKSFHFNINNELHKFGFKSFYSIEIKGDVGRIFIIGKDNMKMYMSNSSSGFIQLFPIIACCVLSKINHSKSDLEEFISFKYIKNEFPNNFYGSASETDFHALFIEQPELHLHPKLQSQLAELLADTIKDANIFSSLFIETHSEHLIRKIQVLIAKGELEKNKVGVWYFDNSEGTTKIKEMQIEPNGFFKEPWPNGFFDDSANLSWDLLTANKS